MLDCYVSIIVVFGTIGPLLRGDFGNVGPWHPLKAWPRIHSVILDHKFPERIREGKNKRVQI